MCRKIPIRIRKEKFIEKYLQENEFTSVLDEKFHDAWYKEFGGKRDVRHWGCSPSLNAMTWLKKLYDQGTLVRGRVSIPEHGTGFPNWIYGYSLNPKFYN